MRVTNQQILTQEPWRQLLVLALLIVGTVASAQITPSADAYTNTNSATTNFGASTTLNVVSGSETSFVQFNLSSIPTGYTSANVAQATLKLYVNALTTAGSFNVDYVTSAWSEAAITADNSPTIGNAVVETVALTSANVHNYLQIDVTSAVGAWLNGTQANDGIALVPNTSINASFDSKENTAQSHPAELDIVFIDNSEGTITGVTTSGSSGLVGGGTSGSLNLSLDTSCASGQVLQWNGKGWICSSTGTGTITGVTAGLGLTGGGTKGNVTISLNSTDIPLVDQENIFTASQEFESTVTLPMTTSSGAGVIYIGSVPMLHDYGSSTSNNTFVGGAGNFTLNTTSTPATSLVGVGFNAMPNVSTSSGSTAVGVNALDNLTSGSYNTALGLFAGQTLTTGSNNTFLGAGAAAGSGSVSNGTAIGSNAEVSQNNAVVLGCVPSVNNCTNPVNVGIGTTIPGQTLDVSGGNAIVRGPNNFQTAGDLAYIYLGDTNHYVKAENATGILFASLNDSNPLYIADGNGYVGIGSNVPTNIFTIQQGLGAAIADGWSTYSSRRWKTNIHTLHGALDKVEHLRGVSYDLKDSGKHEIGVIAEEVGAVVPEIVSWEDNNKDARGVDYGRLTALLIEASKEQQKLIRKQERQLKTQQSQLEAEQVAARIRQAQISALSSQVKTVKAALNASDRTARTLLATTRP